MSEQILVVEDDLAMSSGIRDVLEMNGYRVQLAENGVEGLKALEASRPDLIISDIMMPEMDGFEFLEEVRRHPLWAAVPFIFLTAKGQRPDIRAGKQLGADDYLVKSTDLEDILIVVRAKLDRALTIQQQNRREMDDLKRNLLNMLSHEFRTPLTYITGYVDLIQEGEWSPDDLQKFLSRIKGGSNRLNRLVEDFLLLVRFETDDARQAYLMDKGQFSNWAGLITRLFDHQHETAARKHVTLIFNVAPELPLVEAHEGYLENALQRLVDNGLKFARHTGGHLWVQVYAEGAHVCCSVKDDGVGIPADEVTRVFDRFYQINRQRSEQQGAGIGLAIVKSVADLHHGVVTCTSMEGTGSEFVLRLPAI
jgi:two-component system, sensor histidine kinase and response regulator